MVLLPRSVLSTSFAVMAIGVVSLEIVVALLHLVVARARGFHCPAHFDFDGALLRSRLVVIDKVDGLRLWKEKG